MTLAPRWRLALTHAALVGSLLALLGGGSMAFMERQLQRALDARVASDLDAVPAALQPGPTIEGAADEEYDPGSRFAVLDAGGRVRLASDPAAAVALGFAGDPAEGRGAFAAGDVRLQGRTLRVAATRARVGSETFLVRVARDRAPVEQAVGELRRVLLVVAPAVVALSLVLGYVSASGTLRGIERGVRTVRRFTADAAHELRTPIGAVRALGEVGLRGSRDAAGYRATVEDMLEELGRLSALVDRLLLLARADANQVPIVRRRGDLSVPAAAVVELYRPLAEEAGVDLRLEIGRRAAVRADGALLESALGNLVDNAIKFTPRGGTVLVAVDGPSIAVRDTGPGIPAEHQARLFERFYRVEPSRDRLTGGTGLGLAIARWIVESHAGSIRCTSQAGCGAEFRIRLPEATP